MIGFVVDTDVYTLHSKGDRVVREKVKLVPTNEIALAIITANEVWGGWNALLNRAKSHEQAAYAYARLTESQHQLSYWTIVTASVEALELTEQLRKQKLNAGTNDLKIAAIALTLNATVVTRNVRDFSRVPNLTIEDWTKKVH